MSSFNLLAPAQQTAPYLVLPRDLPRVLPHLHLSPQKSHAAASPSEPGAPPAGELELTCLAAGFKVLSSPDAVPLEDFCTFPFPELSAESLIH